MFTTFTIKSRLMNFKPVKLYFRSEVRYTLVGIASINNQVVNVATLGAPVESVLTSVMVGEKSFVDIMIRYVEANQLM